MLNKHDTFNGCIQNAISIKLKQKLFQKYKIFTKSKIVPKIASCIDNEQIEIDSIKKKKSVLCPKQSLYTKLWRNT